VDQIGGPIFGGSLRGARPPPLGSSRQRRRSDGGHRVSPRPSDVLLGSGSLGRARDRSTRLLREEPGERDLRAASRKRKAGVRPEQRSVRIERVPGPASSVERCGCSRSAPHPAPASAPSSFRFCDRGSEMRSRSSRARSSLPVDEEASETASGRKRPLGRPWARQRRTDWPSTRRLRPPPARGRIFRAASPPCSRRWPVSSGRPARRRRRKRR